MKITEKDNIVRAMVKFIAVQAKSVFTLYSHLLQKSEVPRLVAAQSLFLLKCVFNQSRSSPEIDHQNQRDNLRKIRRTSLWDESREPTALVKALSNIAGIIFI